ncbi:3-keto-disaccharide hydrolase [Fodinibius sediminis]|nr:DUF1080 domain-containing protein [Fodinibius sediminis]
MERIPIHFLVVALFLALPLQAQDTHPVALEGLAAFENPGESWAISGGVTASLETDNQLDISPGTGVLVNIPQGHQGRDLLTNFEHGDIDLELDYMMARGSNSGIYLQGRYEVQLLDSWNVKQPTAGDNGGIYERWDENRPEGERGYQGHPPRQNASRAPGLWQHLEISFRAPRFDSQGRKIANAKIIRATLNGVTIHEDVELSGPTRGALGDGEVSRGPLRLQGDHGAVAFRNISIRQYDRPAPSVNGLSYKVFEGLFTEVPDFDTLKVVKSGASESLTTDVGTLPNQFLIHYAGTLDIKEAGDYRFTLNASGGAGVLRINGQPTVSIENNQGTISLPKGAAAVELMYARQASWGSPGFVLSVSGEGLRRHVLSEDLLGETNGPNPIYVKAGEKPILRSFMDLPKGDRITHAASVSSLDNVHYTYDLNRGNMVQIWRGEFLDATPMWHSRGNGTSRPNGSVEYLVEHPALLVNELKDRQAKWQNDTSGVDFKSRGYLLDDKDNPTFRYEIYGTSVQDKIRVVSEGRGIQRTLTFSNSPDNLYVRLAIGRSIAEDNENRYLVDDQSYYLDIEGEESPQPFIRSVGEQEELLVPVRPKLTYTILF